jgi:vitamin B12 transporter
MILIRIAWPLVMLFSFVSLARAQVITDTLEEVNIRNRKKQVATQDERVRNFSPGQKVQTIDSFTLQQYQMQSVANVLAQQTPVFIKSYGLNGLATLNFRGSSAAQSQVYWNGVPIQNAALGIADVSLLPVSIINKMHIVYGGSAALWGSGNVGGALLLETDQPSFDSLRTVRNSLAIGAGSFGQYQLGGKMAVSNRRWSLSTTVFAQQAENNFKYIDNYGEEKETENSRLKGVAVLPQLVYRPTDHDVLKITAWYQKYYREIPAALFEQSSAKKREDEAVRLLLDWKRKQRQGLVYARTAFLTDRMQYEDSAALQFSNNISYQYFLEGGIKRSFAQRHQLLLFVPAQVSWMNTNEGRKDQHKFAVAAAYTYTDLRERLQASINIRGEMINQQGVVLPGISTSYYLTPGVKLRANVQRTYRAPSLNELYYEPGGNKDLKPEQGWSEDVGYRVESKIGKRVGVVHDVSAFNRVIDDWILWLGGGIWTPHNIASVHSRGIETENLVLAEIGSLRLQLGINAAYVLATTEASYIPNDGSIGKQIPYTPRYNGQVNIGLYYRSIYVNYNHGYTGYRYVNVDESELIPAYTTSNVQLSYSLKLRARNILFTGQVNNLFNEHYQVVRGRPMPGINWAAGVRLLSL